MSQSKPAPIPLDCEQIFDILTRAPFPTGGQSDAAVELHLMSCHECRQLAEALRPAVELFHESISAEESRGLPGYRGLLNSAAPSATLPDLVASLAQAVETERPARKTRPTRWIDWRIDAWRGLAAVLLVASLALLVQLATGPGHLRPGSESLATSDSLELTPHRQVFEYFAKLGLPNDCRHVPLALASHGFGGDHAADPGDPAHPGDAPAGSVAASHEQQDRYQCCTRCHYAGGKRTSETAMVILVASCSRCHDWPQ